MSLGHSHLFLRYNTCDIADGKHYRAWNSPLKYAENTQNITEEGMLIIGFC
jgi:hypothetical protein